MVDMEEPISDDLTDNNPKIWQETWCISANRLLTFGLHFVCLSHWLQSQIKKEKISIILS